MLFLQIIGGIVVGLLVLVVLFYLFIRIKFGKFLNADTQPEPLIIHLNQDINPDWTTGAQAKPIIDELKQLGFVPGEAYLIKEMEGMQLVSMHQGPLCAVVYQHPIAGLWVDLVFNEEDGIEYTVSNAPMGAAIDMPDNNHKIMDPSFTVQDLYQQIKTLKEGSELPLVDINEDNFRAFFEAAYKKEMAWRTRKGGISFAEFVGTSDEASFKTSDKNIKQAFIQMKEDDLYHWHDAALEHHRKTNDLDTDEFYESSYRIIMVPFTSAAEAFINYLEGHDFIDEAQAEKYKQLHSEETDLFTLFETINGHLSPELRAELMAEQDFPLPLKLYQTPEPKY